MKIIGITGPSGSGKSFLAFLFNEYRSRLMNLDETVHDIYDHDFEFINTLINEFGNEITDSVGRINRKSLGKIVFNDSNKLKKLNELVHPYVIKLCLNEVENCSKNGIDYLVFDAPQLFESGLDRYCDVTIGVLADESIRLSRIMNRDLISYNEAVLRLKNQKNDQYYIDRCDLIVYNNNKNKDLMKELVSDFI